MIYTLVSLMISLIQFVFTAASDAKRDGRFPCFVLTVHPLLDSTISSVRSWHVSSGTILEDTDKRWELRRISSKRKKCGQIAISPILSDAL